MSSPKGRPFLEVTGLAKQHEGQRGARPLTVFEHVDMKVERSEFVCMIGHSGCGKSTILNILAGLERATAGTVLMDGREVSGPSLDRGVIFQNHSLLPWKSALSNVEFSVRARFPHYSRAEVREHSLRFVHMVGLKDAEQRKPSQLSGGMRQRVGIARAFAIEPKLLLMDEPFGALDALTRANIQDELITIWQRTKQTVFMITHDVDEAIYLSDRILLMTPGPCARVAEEVVVDIERPRARRALLRDTKYHEIRSRLVEFLTDAHAAQAAHAEHAEDGGLSRTHTATESERPGRSPDYLAEGEPQS